MTRKLTALLSLWILGACARSNAQTPTLTVPSGPRELHHVWVATDYSAKQLAFPLPKSAKPHDFALCGRSVSIVTSNHGVFVAGEDGWLVAPGAHDFTSAGCAPDGSLLLTEGAYLWSFSSPNKSPTLIHEFDGEVALVDTRRDRTFLVAQKSAGGFALLEQQGTTIAERHAFSVLPTARRMIDDETLIAALGREVYLLRAGVEPTKLARFDQEVDGVAVADDATLFVSTARGIMQRRGDGFVPIALGIHGPMRWSARSLFVLDAACSSVVELTRVAHGSLP